MNEAIIDKRKKRAYVFLILATFFLYIILTGAKNLYTAEKTTLAGVFGYLDNPLTAIATTMEYYFYTYAIMQVILAFIMKKINIKWFLTITLGISAVLTAAMALTSTIEQHYLLYVINGFLQAGIWGCSMKVLSIYLPQSFLPAANTLMTAAPAVAGIISYGTAALFGEDWKTPFAVLGAILLLAVAAFFISLSYVHRFPRTATTHHVVHSDGTEEDVDDEEENDFIHLDSKKRVVVFYVVSVFIGFMVTSLFFMINNNLDMFLKEIGGFSNDTAKLLTVLAPVSIVLGPILTVRSCEKHRNFVAVALAFFGLAFVFLLLTFFLFDKSVIASLVLLLVFLILANGGRSVSLSIAGMKMRSKIDTGVYSTLVNVAASLSSGIAPKIIAVFLDDPDFSTVESWRVSFGFAVLWAGAVVVMLVGIIIWIKHLSAKKARQ